MANRLFGLDRSASRSTLGGIASSSGSCRIVSGVEGMASTEVQSKPNAGVMFGRRAGIRLRRLIGGPTSLARLATSDPAAAGRALP
jgi:hypothetical protein